MIWLTNRKNNWNIMLSGNVTWNVYLMSPRFLWFTGDHHPFPYKINWIIHNIIWSYSLVFYHNYFPANVLCKWCIANVKKIVNPWLVYITIIISKWWLNVNKVKWICCESNNICNWRARLCKRLRDYFHAESSARTIFWTSGEGIDSGLGGRGL